MQPIQFTPATEADIPEIQSWIDAESTHREVLKPEFFLTAAPHTLLVSKITDSEGVVFYIRFSKPDDERQISKVNIQFANPEITSPRRNMNALAQGIPMVVKHLSDKYGVRALTYDSVSAPLIAQMEKFGFKRDLNGNEDDYILIFPERDSEKVSSVDVAQASSANAPSPA